MNSIVNRNHVSLNLHLVLLVAIPLSDFFNSSFVPINVDLWLIPPSVISAFISAPSATLRFNLLSAFNLLTF